MANLLIAYDVGSSSVKATLMDADTGKVLGSATSPENVEMGIIALHKGWAEQHPSIWWCHVVATTQTIKNQVKFDPNDVKAVGISYQMHGMVAVDKSQEVLRPSIIWCDGRAVSIGNNATTELGDGWCLDNLLNGIGNFTASKLQWVKENEPDIFNRIHKMMLPGDYIAMKMSGKIQTTASGLSEGILWNFKQNRLATEVLDHFDISPEVIPEIVPTFGPQAELTTAAAKELGLKAGTPICYRGGDQPNNALSLKVLNPGEVAATAGTSGVVYGVTAEDNPDLESRVNIFVHGNHHVDDPRFGILLCLNGTGILNSWIKHNVANGMDYPEMNQNAAEVPIGSEGLVTLPFGNGPERTLGNKNLGASTFGLQFNTHSRAHSLRSAQEGIVFALHYGLQIMADMGMQTNVIRAGHANMFLSPLFREAFACTTGARIELYDTDGSVGAARGAGIGLGIYNLKTAFVGLNQIDTIDPDNAKTKAYADAYAVWLTHLNHQLKMAS